MDLKKKIFKTEFAGKELVLEKSILAGQANSALLGRYGNSSVLVTAVMGKKDSDLHYFPLQVIFQEKFYAVGKILGSRFMRREGRPSDESVLSGRIIDRVIRPLFEQRARRDIQVVLNVLSYDADDDLNFLSLITTSATLAISEIPWGGPVAGVSVAKKDNEIVIKPTEEMKNSGVSFSSFVAGTKEYINMIELEGVEANEEDILSGFEMAHQEIKKLIDFQESIVKEVGKEKVIFSVPVLNDETTKQIIDFARPRLSEVIYLKDKNERDNAVENVTEELKTFLTSIDVDVNENKRAIDDVVEKLTDDIVHENILSNEKRPDGRGLDEIRELYTEVALLQRAHGSGLFIRGNTQALAVATLGAPGAEQIVEDMIVDKKDRFMLHYNFPPFSVGETGPFRGPGRREIGHGALAKKALVNMLPEKEIFPYTIRIVSEILSSNGSSSMATVCASTAALMDAGVPIKKPVAGIAMGLVSDKDGKYKVLTDIQGYEDHYGDADVKVAGTKDGVTAMQMDVKIGGLTMPMLKDELTQAKKARLQILDVITGVIANPRPEISPLAPTILSTKVLPSQIGLIIGSGGKTINGIIEKTGALSIDIDDDGTVFISGENRETAQAALGEVNALVKEYKVGDIVTGEVIKLLDFGAIIDIDEGQEGMIHISEINNEFIKDINTVIKLGDKVQAKVVKIDNGKIGLSIKALKS
ncbi:MAG: polyribonucleotide nucleotidyltransferase [Candidatus Harrisonbacteria bacterium CG10_big_fil_rev_8_21_14_0_10_38_8]|uniref:Polyribonucleotide nucleotidyltransferase n=1 Tax=Candidatus Harrisonbacteria bacterium CG10_big_fil_rev_8_21_14_0_10_38_8 TaxID=1974582 RepID=A0A2M6WK85_9BACT|nr:MAG: polyribonucleotide nucleotidyltransferase [Candidatus Harrisonbacteria bacterium CG10_big_fil_rev_8_21_14_0_10_38_8]